MKKERPQPAILPPPILLRWQTWAVGLAVLLVPFFLPIPMVLRRHPIISPLGDQLHVVLLAGVALLLYWRGPLSGRLWPTALAAAVIGGAIEFVQVPFGRNAHLMDFVLDVVGIGLVVGYILWRGHGLRVGLALMLALLMVLPFRLYHVPFVAVASYRSNDLFPVLSDLEGRRDGWLWTSNQASVTVEASETTPTGRGHLVRLAAGPPADWPGAEMRRFPHDWTGYDHLVVDVRVVNQPGADPAATQRFSIRIDDFLGRREHNWIATALVATPEWTSVRVPLQDRPVNDGLRDLDRIFDLRDVDRILFYLPRPEARAVLEFDNLRLE